ncbi:MAG: AraC family transcriptional regulator [Tannerellaceae bacterium]|nr:AraC family transcriptional regulator [Tannerellaceae bacterium]
MELYIKNMVCNRCILVVEGIFKATDIEPESVTLGKVTLKEELSNVQKDTLRQQLESVGFELLDDKRIRLIEQIKNRIIELVHQHNNRLKINLSEYLSSTLNHEYGYLSTLFSESEQTTIEKYFIAQKIERVKELLVYDELTLNEIADMLNYSSAAHLSTQFKNVTGLTPSRFKALKENDKRKPLDQV